MSVRMLEEGEWGMVPAGREFGFAGAGAGNGVEGGDLSGCGAGN